MPALPKFEFLSGSNDNEKSKVTSKKVEDDNEDSNSASSRSKAISAVSSASGTISKAP
jgi:hypothetical protein